MEIPKRKRVNTLGIRYLRGTAEDKHYDRILKDILGLTKRDVIAIDERDNMHILFKVATKETYDRICDENTYIHYEVEENNAIIVVEDLSSYRTKVAIKHIPFEVTSNDILGILENYGDIDKSLYTVKPENDWYQEVQTGRMIVMMELHSPIPINYPQQPPTCNTCGSLQHKYRFC